MLGGRVAVLPTVRPRTAHTSSLREVQCEAAGQDPLIIQGEEKL